MSTLPGLSTIPHITGMFERSTAPPPPSWMQAHGGPSPLYRLHQARSARPALPTEETTFPHLPHCPGQPAAMSPTMSIATTQPITTTAILPGRPTARTPASASPALTKHHLLLAGGRKQRLRHHRSQRRHLVVRSPPCHRARQSSKSPALPMEATNISTSPTLSWSASSNNTNYTYCYDTTNNNNCNTSWSSNGTSTKYRSLQLERKHHLLLAGGR